jgi:hypothetical protein
MQQSSCGSSLPGRLSDSYEEDDDWIPRSPSSKAVTPYTPRSEAEDLSLQELINYCEGLQSN